MQSEGKKPPGRRSANVNTGSKGMKQRWRHWRTGENTR
nr:MAG TPA: Phosducin [Caudoviricetes sp.]